ncbi:hypothetical protein LLG07_06980 [bacterium]|nr:hypothetical protein [bacterium]
MKTKGQIIGVFHGDAAYMTLNDEAYNTYRKVTTGNPYKELIAELIKQGVQSPWKIIIGLMMICCRVLKFTAEQLDA